MQCKQQQISANARQFSPPFLLEIHIEVPEETDNYFFGAQIFFFFPCFCLSDFWVWFSGDNHFVAFSQAVIHSPPAVI